MTDLPQRILAVAVAALPERRRDWGLAMLAELHEVTRRRDRWAFALSGVRATLLIPPAGGWSVLALVAAAAIASVVAVGRVVRAELPALTVFAMTFTAVLGALVILGVARSAKPRLPAPVPTLVVGGAVAASIVAVVVFLHREPAAARYLPAPAAAYLAAVLAGCLWIAVTSPRPLGTTRLAPYLGAAAAVVLAAWSLLLYRLEPVEPPIVVAEVLGIGLMLTPFAVFAVPAFLASRSAGRGAGRAAGGSRRAGVQALVWTLAAAMPLTFALWLPEALRRHAIDGHTLDGEVVAPVGVNLADAIVFCLGLLPVFGTVLGTAGAAVGARRRG